MKCFFITSILVIVLCFNSHSQRSEITTTPCYNLIAITTSESATSLLSNDSNFRNYFAIRSSNEDSSFIWDVLLYFALPVGSMLVFIFFASVLSVIISGILWLFYIKQGSKNKIYYSLLNFPAIYFYGFVGAYYAELNNIYYTAYDSLGPFIGIFLYSFFVILVTKEAFLGQIQIMAMEGPNAHFMQTSDQVSTLATLILLKNGWAVVWSFLIFFLIGFDWIQVLYGKIPYKLASFFFY